MNIKLNIPLLQLTQEKGDQEISGKTGEHHSSMIISQKPLPRKPMLAKNIIFEQLTFR